MEIQDIITPDRVVNDLNVSSKKRALETVSEILARGSQSLASQDVCESLFAREKLGSTSIGSGVAIPHGRLKNTEQTIAAFIKLEQGIDYDAIDKQAVDLIFALLVPENSTQEHLNLLAEIAEMFSIETIREKIRQCEDADSLCHLLQNWKNHINN
ncbi:MAG: PTS IIA-like nitrogen regulatory protein PtsN [Gammaproteobacteria bacterium]|nr:PTS IIA-like nitrogen regulatory protein PtsN [Gammaproteobacteria bacterium]MDH5801543.1 PTS IIA-like nitrogen regulatory protein PtsN [Gammaproteobacteria bacterium]